MTVIPQLLDKIGFSSHPDPDVGPSDSRGAPQGTKKLYEILGLSYFKIILFYEYFICVYTLKYDIGHSVNVENHCSWYLGAQRKLKGDQRPWQI